MIAAILVGLLAAPELPDLGWMTGQWLACTDGSVTSETWTGADGGVMVGMSKTVSKGRASWEFTRIALDGGKPTFFAQPSGQPAATFTAVTIEPGRIVFENRAHDFPQRVIYRRDGTGLVGRIEGSIGGKARSAEWRFRPAAAGPNCP
jgi:hypothetical protein